MGRQRIRRLRNVIIGILKDKASLAKALTLSGDSTTLVAVIRATTHHPASSPPSERRVATVLLLGGQEGATRHASCACVAALMDRLERTGSAAVALKCLVVAHRAARSGSFILRDQLSSCPAFGGRNFLNLSAFRDDSDHHTLRLSAWVTWHAAVVEQRLTVSRIIGYDLSSDSTVSLREKVPSLPSSELVVELDALVGYVERTRDVPDSVNYLQKYDLVYDVLKLVQQDYKLVQREILARVRELRERIVDGEDDDPSLTRILNYLKRLEILKLVQQDYKLVQREILARVRELRERIVDGEDDDPSLTRILNYLKRLEDCKERLVSVFLRKRRDDEFWYVIGGLKMMIEEMIKDDRLLLIRDYDDVNHHDYQKIKGSDSRFQNNPFVEPGQWLVVPIPNYGH